MKTLNVTFEITNEELFNNLVIDVDTSGLENHERYFSGELRIELYDEEFPRDIVGDFGENDYKTDYGFILKTTYKRSL